MSQKCILELEMPMDYFNDYKGFEKFIRNDCGPSVWTAVKKLESVSQEIPASRILSVQVSCTTDLKEIKECTGSVKIGF